MKLLYLECNMGAAGDMLSAALYELLSETQQQEFLNIMNGLSDQICVSPIPARTQGICGTRMQILINGQAEDNAGNSHPAQQIHSGSTCHGQGHHASENSTYHLHDHHASDDNGHHHHVHTSPEEIRRIIDGFRIPAAVKEDVHAVYADIAEAESHVHGVPVSQIHFHEVGMLDAVADITAVCLAVRMLSPERIMTSPVHVGSGEVHCAHGTVPVPAPATACLLRGVPCYSGEIRGELCTPTGAALLAHFSDAFGPMPVMAPEQIGYGIGTREYPAANCVRAILGESAQADPQASDETDEVIELVCNIDDMTAEELAFAGERLMEDGALDIAYTAVTMKKGRPATQLTVLCRPEDEKDLACAVLRETTSNGVRVRRCRRYLLTPSVETADTRFGKIRVKTAEGYGISHRKPEYEDLAAIARDTGLSIRQVRKNAAEWTKKQDLSM